MLAAVGQSQGAEMPDLSVVIVSYNTRRLLRDCLRSLRASVGLALEVIVVDNASSDGSADMVRDEFPEVVLLAQPQNTWYCGGNSIGVSRAAADIVLLLNPDTVVAPDALARMRRFLMDSPDVVGVTAQMRYPDGQIQPTCSKIPSYFSLLLNYTALGFLLPMTKKRVRADLLYADWDRESSRAVEVIPGSCTMMRRGDIRLDDDLLLYFPEDALARRHRRPSYFLAKAKIKHYEKSSTRTRLAATIFFRDMFVYCRKHHGILPMLLLWCLSRPIYWAMWLKNRK